MCGTGRVHLTILGLQKENDGVCIGLLCRSCCLEAQVVRGGGSCPGRAGGEDMQ